LAVLSRLDLAEKRKKIKLCAAHLISILKQCAEVGPGRKLREVGTPI